MEWKEQKLIATFCNTCGTAYALKRQPLLQCGRCKGTWYCSKECQKKDWKNHKKMCMDVSVIIKENAKLCGGKDFVKYVDDWRKGSAMMFSLLVKSAIRPHRRTTHVLILYSRFFGDFEERVEIEGLSFSVPKVQIEQYEIVAIDSLATSEGSLMRAIYESLIVNLSIQKSRDVYNLCNIIINTDNPNAEPLVRMTNIGTDKDESALLSVDEYIAHLNRGVINTELL